jgi:alpha-acetolactate decarboxylase
MHRFTVLIALGILVGSPAIAQHHGSRSSQGAPAIASPEPQGLFGVRAYGEFRLFMQRQDYSPKVALPDAKAPDPTDGVGALSGLRGEISLIDGRYIVTYGGGCQTCPAAHSETAALLGTARVTAWHEPVAIPQTLSGKALDDFIIVQAQAKGLDTTRPFPVRMSGMLVDVEMHVIEAPNEGFTGHGSKVHMAKQDEYKHARLSGTVVGFYAPQSMFAVLTHPGELFHFHWINDGRTRTAHLDAFGMEKGAALLLPKE